MSNSDNNEILLLQVKDMLRELQESYYRLSETMTEDYKKLVERIEKLEVKANE